ncbi:HlyD family efflux transporter periplasmic adaptor subunit [Lautropia mirabilis]|uniref:HlyD family efflux transporter periplasmic adaptor subunit n=1 Tax=Lautropia mirabilis TaxID=47671 RepID=UPI0028E7D20D|nr:HlyD family efflux transporter periplasmic adaptor subunit [Lautropia mirabilis]
MNNGLFREEASTKRGLHDMGSVYIHQPPSYYTISISMLLVVAGIILYAYFGTYTKRATVHGLVMPENGLFRVTSPASGQVSGIEVREGEHVNKGQPLFRITNAQISKSGETNEQVRKQISKRISLMQDRIGRSAANHDREKELIEQRLQAMTSEISQLEHELQILGQREEIALSQKERISKQAKKGFASLSRLGQAESELLDLSRQKLTAEREISSLHREKSSLYSSMVDITNRHQSQQTESENSLASLRQELAELDVRQESITSAPFNGTVTGVHAREGTTVTTSSLLASLIPDNAKLTAYLYVAESKAAFLAKGQKVRIRLDAYPYQKYGMVTGSVTAVTQSPYAITELPAHVATAVQSDNENQSLYYQARVELDSQSIRANGEDTKLKAGMIFEADVMQEKRRLYEWVLEPIYSMTGKF